MSDCWSSTKTKIKRSKEMKVAKHFWWKLCPLPSGAPGRGSMPPSPCYSSEDVISCQLTRSVQCAHQKPITVLRAAAGRVVTGSQDHTVRVTLTILTKRLRRVWCVQISSHLISNSFNFDRMSCYSCCSVLTDLLLFSCQIYRLEDSCCLFTLQGHSGGITSIYIDQVSDTASSNPQ